MEEIQVLAKEVELNLVGGHKGKFTILIDEKGMLEIIPFTKKGDPKDWSLVLGIDGEGEHSLFYRD